MVNRFRWCMSPTYAGASAVPAAEVAALLSLAPVKPAQDFGLSKLSGGQAHTVHCMHCLPYWRHCWCWSSLAAGACKC